MSRKTQNYLFYGLTCLFGLMLSLVNIFGPQKALCLTNGCEILRSFTLFGFKLWPVAAIFFAILLGATPFPKIRRILTAFALVADILLLLLMLMAAPCVMCLGVGFCLALCFFFTNPLKMPERLLLSAWSLLFVMQLGILVSDAFEKHVIYDSGKGPDIYWSPSCAACMELVRKAPSGRWHPVAENDDDIPLIAKIERHKDAASLADAIEGAKKDDRPVTAFEHFTTRLRLWKNEARVLSSGVPVLPHIEYAGVPPKFCTDDCGSPMGEDVLKAFDDPAALLRIEK